MSLGIQARAALTDEELASCYQATSDPEYFAQIFARHRRLVFCACRRFFGCGGLAEDATQETFLHAYQGLQRFQLGNVRGWLMRIAKNVCIDLWRKRRPESHSPEVGSIDLPDKVNLDHRIEESHSLAGAGHFRDSTRSWTKFVHLHLRLSLTLARAHRKEKDAAPLERCGISTLQPFM